jgi:hypothetical protein
MRLQLLCPVKATWRVRANALAPDLRAAHARRPRPRRSENADKQTRLMSMSVVGSAPALRSAMPRKYQSWLASPSSRRPPEGGADISPSSAAREPGSAGAWQADRRLAIPSDTQMEACAAADAMVCGLSLCRCDRHDLCVRVRMWAPRGSETKGRGQQAAKHA